jgi:hypothetical protein
MSLITRTLFAAALAGAASACGDASTPPVQHEQPARLGRLEIALTGETASGNTYQLRDAIITVVGPEDEYYFDSEHDPDASLLSREVPEGEYRLYLEDGWRLDRLESDGSISEDVPAAYVSNNPQVFYVYPNETRLVFMKFQAGDQVASFGSFQVAIAVEELDDETPPDDGEPDAPTP